ncbi:hypothetical protein [Echinicola sp. 20G]|uniref:hypothetical protein n=1 Tax=Echinicola sp. 20G TaxID=2781961 RepID=UPI001910BC06|nr:hypothetical protein [Echinicola sp. 20G]
MKKLLLLFFYFFIFISCTDDTEPNSVNIRLRNVSSYDFKNIVINTGTGNAELGDLDANHTSSYRAYESAYRYAYIKVEIEGDAYVIQPIDFVGETPLKNGKYTYQIDANDSEEQHGKLSLSFIKD